MRAREKEYLLNGVENQMDGVQAILFFEGNEMPHFYLYPLNNSINVWCLYNNYYTPFLFDHETSRKIKIKAKIPKGSQIPECELIEGK